MRHTTRNLTLTTATLVTGLILTGCAGHATSDGRGTDAPDVAGEVILCAGGSNWDTSPAQVNTSTQGDTSYIYCDSPARTSGSWEGFTVGDHLECAGDGASWESDGRDPGDDPDLPDGGWWIHCA